MVKRVAQQTGAWFWQMVATGPCLRLNWRRPLAGRKRLVVRGAGLMTQSSLLTAAIDPLRSLADSEAVVHVGNCMNNWVAEPQE